MPSVAIFISNKKPRLWPAGNQFTRLLLGHPRTLKATLKESARNRDCSSFSANPCEEIPLLNIRALLVLLAALAVWPAHAVQCRQLFLGQTWRQLFDDKGYGKLGDYYAKTKLVLPKKPRGLEKIREAISENGLTVVYDLDVSWMKKSEIEDMKRMMGHGTLLPGGKHRLQILILSDAGYQLAADGSPNIVYHPGVVLHMGVEPLLANYVRSIKPEWNISMGTGDYHGRFDNKVLEAQKTAKVLPDLMGEFVTGKDLLNDKKNERALRIHALRKQLVIALEKFTMKTGRGAVPKKTQELARELVEEFVTLAKEVQGDAFIKYAYESGTGDYDVMLTTFKNRPATIGSRVAKKFMTDVAAIKNKAQRLLREARRLEPGGTTPAAISFTDPSFQKILRALDEGYTNFLNALLANPGELMVQKKVGVAKLPSGVVAEYRVHFLDGKVVQVVARDGYDIIPEFEALAARTFENFLAKAPKEFRFLMGGADIMIGPDLARPAREGEPPAYVGKLIEGNYGAQSGFMDSFYYPFTGNDYIARLVFGPNRDPLKENTPLLLKYEQLIEAAYGGDPKGLIIELRRRQNSIYGADKFYEKWEESDIPDDEAFAWFTRRVLERYQAHKAENPGSRQLRKALDQSERVVDEVFAGLTIDQRKTPDLLEILGVLREHFKRERESL